jgi:GGDEF domain-containing protein
MLRPLTGTPAARLASACIGLVVLSLTGAGAWVTMGAHDRIADVRAQEASVVRYDALQRTIIAERTAITSDWLPADRHAPRLSGAATQKVEESLRVLAREGTADDAALVRTVRADHRTLLGAQAAVRVAAVNGRDLRTLPETALIVATFQHMLDAIAAAAGEAHGGTLQALDDLEATEHDVVLDALLGGGIGLLLILVCTALIVLHRRAEASGRARELSRLAERARSDSLTQLGNHRAFHEDLPEHLAETEAAILLVDLVGLKETNDLQGHHAGDDRLRQLAAVLRNLGGSAYRIGGDEFALAVAPHVLDIVLARLERLATPLPCGGRGVAVGICPATPGIGGDEVVRRAGIALALAKRGDGFSVAYEPGLEERYVLRSGAESRRRITTALARAVDAKDSYTRSHSQTVSELCVAIGARLGLGADRLERLGLAGLLHDVGKIGIADSILQKPGPLTDAEYETMKGHARLGHEIVQGAGFAIEADWILHHHERLDGRGYPDGLAGESVPLESRIILVADSFEAITSDRPYRRSRGADEALAELHRHAGTQFDLACVEALERALLAGEAGSRLAA